jgi:hypothetical protein
LLFQFPYRSFRFVGHLFNKLCKPRKITPNLPHAVMHFGNEEAKLGRVISTLNYARVLRRDTHDPIRGVRAIEEQPLHFISYSLKLLNVTTTLGNLGGANLIKQE